MKICYYISGHGYGHAVRSVEVIKELLKNSSVHVFIRTGAPEWLFGGVVIQGAEYQYCLIEAGIVQQNSFSVDKKATLQAAAALFKNKQSILARELSFIRQRQIELAVVDHTPLAFEAAAQAGIPAVGAANFSWDWIYQDYLAEFPEYQGTVENILHCYRFADTLYRLPFYGPMDFYSYIRDVPLVGRKSIANRKRVREILAPDKKNKKLVLIALKAQDLKSVHWEMVGTLSDYQFILLSSNAPRQRNVTIYSEGLLPFEELVSSCDAVVSKPGYSMVAEIIANKTPMVYIPRQDFVEDGPLIEGLAQYAVAESMNLEAFNAGEWGSFLDRLFRRPQVWPEIPVNGAEVIARALLLQGG